MCNPATPERPETGREGPLYCWSVAFFRFLGYTVGEVIHMNKERLGAFIGERRRELGLTQKDLAGRLHVTDKAVSKWERGLSYPDVTLLEPLAGALGLNMEELMACRRQEIADLCRRSVEVEPYNETLYQHLMRSLLELGQQQEAVSVYEEMSQLLFDSFGIMPSDETRAIYREAMRTVNDKAVSIHTLQEQLREPEGTTGALFCDYDFFKVLYHAEARAVARSGDAVHIGLLSVTDEHNQELPKRSLDRCMENLQELIRTSLRKGDIAARCSISQYILMLPQANYENSCKVCERIIRAFTRQYPHSPACLHCSVQPLEPNT